MIQFSISKPSKQKLTLNSTYSKLNNHLWEVKKNVSQMAHSNLTLKSKITFYAESKNKKLRHEVQSEQSLKQKQKLTRLYAQIKQQNTWLQKTAANIQEKQFQKLLKQKKKVESKLKKVTKKGIKMQKKLQYYNQRKFFPTQDEQNQLNSDQVIEQLQTQNKQLQILLAHKDQKLSTNKKQINSLNKQIIYLLQMKNSFRKMKSQMDKKKKQMN